MRIVSQTYGESYYEEHKSAGLDYLAHGPWQENYGRWLRDSLALRGDGIVGLDVGCACGSIAYGIHKSGIMMHGIDLNNHTISLGKRHFPACSLNVCDAVNLHLFDAEFFDLVHAHQTFEHFKPELVPLILQELRRVLKRGALLVTIQDTEELFIRQGRNPQSEEDVTHICVKPRQWWDVAFSGAGFLDVTANYLHRMRNHYTGFMEKYDWEVWVLQKPPET